MAGAVRGLGAALLLVGCGVWAWVVRLEGPVDRAAANADGQGLVLVELELYVLDLRLAPLLLAIAGVGLLVAPSVGRVSQGVLAMTAAAIVSLVFPVAVPPLTAAWGAVLLVIMLGSIALVTMLMFGSWARDGGDGSLSVPARVLTGIVAVTMLSSAFPMAAFLAFNDSVLHRLPDGYLAAVPVLQGLTLGAGLLALLLAARRLTWLHAAAILLTMAEMMALLRLPMGAFGLATVVLVAVPVATGAAVAGERGRVWSRAVVSGLGLVALLYPVGVVVAGSGSFTLGAAPLALNGGEISYDGLPVYLTGPFSALLPVLVYVFCCGLFDPGGFVPVDDASPATLDDTGPGVPEQAAT